MPVPLRRAQEVVRLTERLASLRHKGDHQAIQASLRDAGMADGWRMAYGCFLGGGDLLLQGTKYGDADLEATDHDHQRVTWRGGGELSGWPGHPGHPGEW